MKEKLKRRWLRLSVRTLLIAVTIFCVWLGWQVSIVRERKGLIALVSQVGGATYALEEPWVDPGDPGFIRRILGDKPWLHIALPKKHDPDLLSSVDRAFPEA